MGSRTTRRRPVPVPRRDRQRLLCRPMTAARPRLYISLSPPVLPSLRSRSRVSRPSAPTSGSFARTYILCLLPRRHTSSTTVCRLRSPSRPRHPLHLSTFFFFSFFSFSFTFPFFAFLFLPSPVCYLIVYSLCQSPVVHLYHRSFYSPPPARRNSNNARLSGPASNSYPNQIRNRTPSSRPPNRSMTRAPQEPLVYPCFALTHAQSLLSSCSHGSPPSLRPASPVLSQLDAREPGTGC